jgi:hypothetical protein
MDALWAIAAKIPTTGPGAADAITYTTILHAIRQSLIVDVPTGETESEVAARRERGVVEGRRIWEDVVKKWSTANLIIEEELVCSMGRLLLIGSRPQDWDDVLSLVEQTMDIPRLVPRLGTPARQEAGFPRLRAPHTLAEYKLDDDHLARNKNSTRGDEFLALTSSNPLTYATPGNNTLAIIQEACLKIVANKAMDEYWDMLTDPISYNITPDVKNLNQRLRLLRQARASAAAVKLLEDDFLAKGQMPWIGTFRIAMSTCVRDKNNHNSLKHASRILQIMTTTFPDADAKVVEMYAKLALGFPLATGDDLVDALTYLQPITKNLRLQLSVGGEHTRDNGVGAVYLTGEKKREALDALSRIYGVYDKLLLSNLVAEEKKTPLKVERARLSSYIKRMAYKGGGGGEEMAVTREELGLDDTTSALSEKANEYNRKGERKRREKDDERKPRTWKIGNTLPVEKRKRWIQSSGAVDSA